MRNFFGKSGLTSTSANHISNLAKEYYQKVEQQIKDIKLSEISVCLLGKLGETTVQKASPKEDFDSIPEKLRKIAECKALIAFLREALKEKERAARNLPTMNSLFAPEEIPTEPVEAELGRIHPRRPELTDPDEIMESWSIGKLNKYFELEAKASTLGEMIHRNGFLNTLRKDAEEREEIKVSGTGRDTLVYTYTPSIKGESIDKMFFKLQEEYRSTQAELNSMKQEIEDAVMKGHEEANKQYQQEVMEYNAKMREIQAKVNIARQAELERVMALKIVIPDNLKPIYEEIKSLSK